MSFILRNFDYNSEVLGADLRNPSFELPRLVLKRTALEHNMATMAAFCLAHGACLAPHAKTTMAPKILRRQVDHGAWAMTVASMQQLRVCTDAGINRISGGERGRELGGGGVAR